MAPPFPFFVKGLIEIFSPKLQSFPLWFVFYTTPISFGSKNFKKIALPSRDWIGRKRILLGQRLCMLLWRIDVSGIKGELPLKRYAWIAFQPSGTPPGLASTLDNKVLLIVETDSEWELFFHFGFRFSCRRINSISPQDRPLNGLFITPTKHAH